ncbi:MAG: aminotransferase class V-fold PLP-dependent enzyme [Sphingobacteriia bacterium]|nr:MAG: aminotransferase class V-fold PLP-dependent enzyme [Sphingobacteriia bacterium]
MGNRRNFIQQVGTWVGVFAGQGLFQTLQAADFARASAPLKGLSLDAVAVDEDYWSFVQQAYTVPSGLINLNNGGVSPSPQVVQDAVEKYNKIANQGPSYYMWRILDQGREPLRRQLAALAGADPEEIAINRNATEALNTVIYGLPLQKGDEVVGTKQDYPNMIQAWKQRALRDGVVYKQLNFDFPIENDQTIVDAFAAAITPRTKLLHLTHVINWVGQILPVKKIADMAHAKGIEVLVDGAHSFGLLDFAVPALGADYFGTSLHKFLSAPIGSGMLWIKREKIEKIWPLICAEPSQSQNIRKFENLGTRSFPIEQGIGEAIHFHEAIGAARKEARIRYLKDYWAGRAQSIPGVRLHTSLQPAYSCAIAGVSIAGKTPAQIDQALWSKYHIHSVGIVWENISCVRITPHVYTRLSDLDLLVKALAEIARSV